MKRVLMMCGMAMVAACSPAAQNGESKVATNVVSRPVQQGVFTDTGCKATPTERFDPCSCKSDIVAAQSGDEEIDARLLRLAERLVCRGEASEVPEGVLINQRSLDFDVTRDDDRWLSVVYSFHEMNAGAAHGMTTQDVMLYDKQNKRWVSQVELIAPAHYAAAERHVREQLQQANAEQYDGMLWPERIEQIFTRQGCEGCVIYPAAQGWRVTFMPYGAGPYAAGLVTVPLDNGFINQ